MKNKDSDLIKSNRIIKSVIASMSFEGLKPSRKAKVIAKKYLEGSVSSKEALDQIFNQKWNIELTNKY